MNPLKIFWKKGKKGYLQKFLPNLPKIVKISIFRKLRYIVPFLPFFTLLMKNGSGDPFSMSTLFLSRKASNQKPKKYHFLKFWKNDPKWSYRGTKMFTHVYLLFGLTNFDHIYGQEGPNTYRLDSENFFWKKDKKL